MSCLSVEDKIVPTISSKRIFKNLLVSTSFCTFRLERGEAIQLAALSLRVLFTHPAPLQGGIPMF